MTATPRIPRVGHPAQGSRSLAGGHRSRGSRRAPDEHTRRGPGCRGRGGAEALTARGGGGCSLGGQVPGSLAGAGKVRGGLPRRPNGRKRRQGGQAVGADSALSAWGPPLARSPQGQLKSIVVLAFPQTVNNNNNWTNLLLTVPKRRARCHSGLTQEPQRQEGKAGAAV